MDLLTTCHRAKVCLRIDNRSWSRGRAPLATARQQGLLRLGLFVGCAFLLSDPSGAAAATPAGSGPSPAAQLFERYCIRCHGQDGRGGPARSTTPVIPDFTDPAFHQSHTNIQMSLSILEGKDRQMPANAGVITEEQAAQLVAYIRATFGPAQPSPSATPGATSDIWVKFKELEQQADDLARQARDVDAAPFTPGVARSRSSAPGTDLFFAQNCAGCHTIGGGALTGPDLRHVTQRKDRSWLVQYLQNPKAVIESGDPYVLHLLAEARGVIMPRPFGMTRSRAETLLDFIETESKLDKSQFAGPPVPDTAFPAGDAARGRELFAGRQPLANGGPACINCHTVHGLEGREGGRLGPDLTKAYERVGGRISLTARLWAPATPTMQPLYKDHALELGEVMSLVAYLEEEDRRGAEQSAAPPLHFLLLGLGGAVLGLVTVNLFWGVRRGPGRPPVLAAGIAAPRPEAELGPLSSKRILETAMPPHSEVR
jgi:mono/diheme cytochrome c family protein